ncbi:MAG: CDP-glycerol:glycerophosphate glycerophosphotransferase [Nocardioidaceae bacterium]|nr:CDP-glycerol:glycerophosphate glycerophosphotransferase [Nocardioidaceae bacterium]
MAVDRARVQQRLIRLAKAGPGRVRGPIGRATRRFRSEFAGPMVTVVVPVSDQETTRIGPCLDTLRAQTHRNLDIVVVPYGRHEQVEAIASTHAAQDWRVRVRRPVATLATARNLGVAAARADLMIVAAGGDDFVLRGVARLVEAHRHSGAPLVVGRMKPSNTVGWTASAPYDAAHRVDSRVTTLAESPVAITDLGLGNKLFTRSLWRAAGLAFSDALPSGADVAIGLLGAGDRIDLLKEFTYVPSGREDGVGVGTMPDVLAGLQDWIEEHERTWQAIDRRDKPDVRDWWLWGILETAVQPLVADAERADDQQWATLRELIGLLLKSADEDVWASLSAESRIKLWLLQHDHREQLAAFNAARLFTGGHRPTVVREGRVWAELPFHDDDELAIPAGLFEMTEQETGLRAMLREVSWLEDRIELTVFAAIDDVSMSDLPQVRCSLVATTTGERIPLELDQYRDPRGNQGGRRYQDFSWGAFVATVPLAALVAASDPAGLDASGLTWAVEITMTVDGVTRTGPITKLDEQGSAGYIGQNHLAPRPYGGAVVGFSPRSTVVGMRVYAETGPRLREVHIDGRRVWGTLRPASTTSEIRAVRAAMGALQVRAATVVDADGWVRFDLELPDPWSGKFLWLLTAISGDGVEEKIGWPQLPDQWLGLGGGELVATRDNDGNAELREAAGLLVVDEINVEGLEVTAQGRWLGKPPAGEVTAQLIGRKAVITGAVTTDQTSQTGQARLQFSLLDDPWGLGEQPVPVGTYWLNVLTDGTPARALLGESAVDQLHRFMVGEHYTARVMRAQRDAGIELVKPLTLDERGPFAQESLQEWFRTTDLPVDQHAVYLQAYAGASATDSQLALHHELRRTRPDLTLYWGVSEAASWVPEGGVRVVMNSRRWYEILATATYLCMNIDPDRWFEHRPGQRLLQTFHGYPAKSMGLRMWRGKHYTPKRIDLELARTSGHWDLILTPHPDMDEHYRREYAYQGEIHSHGYPRDDELVSPGAADVRAETRRRLGIRPHQKAVLYAPTWRDDLATNWRSAEMVRHLDLEAASRALGPDYVLLMRGHRFHTAASSPLNDGTARFLDVTDYPEINHLILASDAAVLDYSSLRFDFALTGRPMIFLVPDLADYVGGVRGFLYDYSDSAPGPLVDTADEAVAWLRDFDRLTGHCAPLLEQFHDSYNAYQDGQSARLVAESFFGRSRE